MRKFVGTIAAAGLAAGTALPSAAIDEPSSAPATMRAADACRGTVCRQIGTAVYAPERNLLSVAPLHPGSRVVAPAALTDCLVATPTEPPRAPTMPALASFDDAAAVVGALSAEFGLVDPPAIQAFSTQATMAWIAGDAAASAEPLAAVRAETSLIVATVALDLDCLGGPERLQPTFDDALSRLPLAPAGATAAADEAFWKAYEQFLRQHGSHLIAGVRIGSRFTHWEALRPAVPGVTVEQLIRKTCATLEGLESTEGSLLPRCGNVANRERGAARDQASAAHSLAQGGARETRVVLEEGFDRHALDALLRHAGDADQPASLEYRPLWTVLARPYGAECDRQRDAPERPACQQLQRVVNLQAAYEGWLALRCATLASGNGFVYQRLDRLTPDGDIGRQTWSCQQSKTGCQSHDSCHYAAGPAMCFCHGANCIAPAELLPGTLTWRNGIRWQRYGGGRDGVNGSCHYVAFKGCQCDPGWNGELPARALYVQALPGAPGAETRP